VTGAEIVVVTSGFPRVSETFALGELLALRAQGLLAAVFATKPGDGAPPQPGVAELPDGVEVLPPGSPRRQAAAMLDRLGGRRVGAFHGYFAHQPAAVAAAAAAATGARFGFGVHALDARKVPPAELASRARDASVVVACNHDVAEPVRAAAQLGMHFSLRIVGAGPEHARLAAAIEAAGLSDRVRLAGPATHAELPDRYAEADVVVVPSVVDQSGDRDGLPNVVLEAMASGRPLVASAVAAIPTAVAHRRTGLLVPPGDPAALAGALTELATAPELRARLGAAARQRVERDFDLERCTWRLGRVLEEAYG